MKWIVGVSVIIVILWVIVGGGIGLFFGMYSKCFFLVIVFFFDLFSIVFMVMIFFFVLKEVLVFENGIVLELFYLRVIF